MFGTYLIELVIGLSFLFAVLALVTTAATESLMAALSLRSSHLQAWLKQWTSDYLAGVMTSTVAPTVAGAAPPSTTAAKLEEAPLLRSLWVVRGDKQKMPSYIPAGQASAALLQLLAMPFGQSCIGRSVREAEQSLREKIGQLENEKLKQALSALLNNAASRAADGSKLVEAFTQEVAGWIDDSMKRIEGLTKRWAKVISMVVALFICGVFNISAYEVLRQLSANPELRAGLAGAAVSYVYTDCGVQGPSVSASAPAPAASVPASTPVAGAAAARVACFKRETELALKAVGPLSQLGIGWDKPPEWFAAEWRADNIGGILRSLGLWLAGVLAAAYAASLGADFWFKWLADIIRLTGRKPASPNETGETGKTGKTA